MARRSGFSRGFSLAELLMALLILSIVITTSMAAFVERNRRQQQAREIVAVYQALANESEYWRRIDYDSLQTEALKGFRTEPIAILGVLGEYNALVAVQQTDPYVKNVTLTVRWMNGKRQARLEVVRVQTGSGNLW